MHGMHGMKSWIFDHKERRERNVVGGRVELEELVGRGHHGSFDVRLATLVLRLAFHAGMRFLGEVDELWIRSGFADFSGWCGGVAWGGFCGISVLRGLR